MAFTELVRAGVHNYKCATPREADVLASVLVEEGVKDGDILVAFPLVGPGLERPVCQPCHALPAEILRENTDGLLRLPLLRGAKTKQFEGWDEAICQ